MNAIPLQVGRKPANQEVGLLKWNAPEMRSCRRMSRVSTMPGQYHELKLLRFHRWKEACGGGAMKPLSIWRIARIKRLRGLEPLPLEGTRQHRQAT